MTDAQPKDQSFDWPNLMRAGIAGLGLAPDEFWSLSPAELRMLLGRDSTPPMDRSRLNDLMRAFPDTQTCAPCIAQHE